METLLNPIIGRCWRGKYGKNVPVKNIEYLGFEFKANDFFLCDLMIGLLPVIFIGERYFLENENT